MVEIAGVGYLGTTENYPKDLGTYQDLERLQLYFLACFVLVGLFRPKDSIYTRKAS